MGALDYICMSNMPTLDRSNFMLFCQFVFLTTSSNICKIYCMRFQMQYSKYSQFNLHLILRIFECVLVKLYMILQGLILILHINTGLDINTAYAGLEISTAYKCRA